MRPAVTAGETRMHGEVAQAQQAHLAAGLGEGFHGVFQQQVAVGPCPWTSRDAEYVHPCSPADAPWITCQRDASRLLHKPLGEPG